ncbi:hypothetical protein HGM15179_008536 [Zosterops borbonicus]|uniref:Uncharacterized protein n=1 Tax=Zosterops borbonicus TaxID=364589 RepID=A0A8K1GIB1_9PASS|nr:hypothetical protein HGM15179_008536 [Zosterops borbonicus]
MQLSLLSLHPEVQLSLPPEVQFPLLSLHPEVQPPLLLPQPAPGEEGPLCKAGSGATDRQTEKTRHDVELILLSKSFGSDGREGFSPPRCDCNDERREGDGVGRAQGGAQHLQGKGSQLQKIHEAIQPATML